MTESPTQRLRTLARKVRRYREISQETMADEIGWSRTAYVQFESGHRVTVSLDEAARICELLDIDGAALITGQPIKVTIDG